MSDEKITGIRYILTLGKMQVTKVDKGSLGQKIKVLLFNQNIQAHFEAPPYADIREGDLLTVYTEVLTNAHADKPPIN